MKLEGMPDRSSEPLESVSKIEEENDAERHSFEMWSKCFLEAESGNFSPEITRNEEGQILAPNGEVSKLPNEDFVKVTRTPSFRKWFGESKVVDPQTGEPVLVYHGTAADISVEEGLDPEHSKGLFKQLWFTSKRANAVTFGDVMKENRLGATFKEKDKTVVYSQFLSLRKPEIVKSFGGVNPNLYMLWTNLMRKAEADGIIVEDRGTYSAFKPESVMHVPSDITQSRRS
jgi:hypothetical protein